MSRHERRAAAAKERHAVSRAELIRTAMECLRAAPATATGATVLLPDGEPFYIPRSAADAMAPPAPTYADGMTAIHEEAAGLMSLDIILREDMPAVIVAAAGGNVQAGELAMRVNGVLSDILAASTSEPKLCAVCSGPLAQGRFALALAVPACDAPINSLAMAVCTDCAATREDVRAKATDVLRQIWPDVRRVTITHPGGGRA